MNISKGLIQFHGIDIRALNDNENLVLRLLMETARVTLFDLRTSSLKTFNRAVERLLDAHRAEQNFLSGNAEAAKQASTLFDWLHQLKENVNGR